MTTTMSNVTSKKRLPKLRTGQTVELAGGDTYSNIYRVGAGDHKWAGVFTDYKRNRHEPREVGKHYSFTRDQVRHILVDGLRPRVKRLDELRMRWPPKDLQELALHAATNLGWSGRVRSVNGKRPKRWQAAIAYLERVAKKEGEEDVIEVLNDCRDLLVDRE